MRVPGVVAWPGTVAPRVSADVVATYDIFSTMLALAGVAAPSDRTIDGRDLTPLLLEPETAASPRECVFYWHGTTDDAFDGLWAARCGAYKAHFVTNTHWNATGVVHDPPLMFHLEFDVSEAYPLDAASDEYARARAHRRGRRRAPRDDRPRLHRQPGRARRRRQLLGLLRRRLAGDAPQLPRVHVRPRELWHRGVRWGGRRVRRREHAPDAVRVGVGRRARTTRVPRGRGVVRAAAVWLN